MYWRSKSVTICLALLCSVILLASFASAKDQLEQHQQLELKHTVKESSEPIGEESASADGGDGGGEGGEGGEGAEGSGGPDGNMVVRSSRGSPNVLISSKNTIRDVRYKKRIIVDRTMGQAMKRIREEAKKTEARETQRHLEESTVKSRELARKQDERDKKARRWQKTFEKQAKKDEKDLVEDAISAAKQTIEIQKEQHQKYKDEKAHTKKIEYEAKLAMLQEKRRLKKEAEVSKKKLEEEHNKNILKAKQLAAEAGEKAQQKVEAANKQEAGRKIAEQQSKAQEAAQKKQDVIHEQGAKKEREQAEQKAKEEFAKQPK